MATDLRQAFHEASELFNEGRYDALGRMCDPDVIMKRVDDPASIVGIGNLIVYLNTHQSPIKPRFESIKIDQHGVRGAAQTNGLVAGTAEYRDKAADNATTPIRFAFTFTRDSDKSDWLLINAFATPLK